LRRCQVTASEAEIPRRLIYIHTSEVSDITFSKRFHWEDINIFRYGILRKGLKRACFQICIPHIWALTTTHLAVSRAMTTGRLFPYSHIIFSAIYYIIILLSLLLLFYFYFCRLTIRLDRFPLGLNQYCTNVPEIRQRNIISHLVHLHPTPLPTTKHKDGVVVTCLNCIYSIAALWYYRVFPTPFHNKLPLFRGAFPQDRSSP